MEYLESKIYFQEIQSGSPIERCLKVFDINGGQDEVPFNIAINEKIKFSKWCIENKIKMKWVGNIRWEYNNQYLLSSHLYYDFYLKR